jgi:hypothetical protein
MREIVVQLQNGNLIQWEQIWIRLVKEEDAKSIYELRNIKALDNKEYINATSGELEDQVEWIKNYKLREATGNEFYLLATNQENSDCWALIRLIFEKDYFIVGSWVSSLNAPFNAAICLELFAKTLGFECMGDVKCRFEIRKNNTQVIKYHKMLGAVQIGEKPKEFIYEVGRAEFMKKRDRILASFKA